MRNQEKIDFWINLWEDIIENFLKKSYGLNLYSPHTLIEDIITEIKDNSFKNPDNKRYFYNKLDYYIKNDEIIINNFSYIFKYLRTIFNDESKLNLILETTKNIATELKKGIYFEQSLSILKNTILKNDEIDTNYINKVEYFSQTIIVELLKKGYILEEIKKFPRNIFSNYIIFKENNGIATSFPHNISRKDFIGENNVQDYDNAVIDYIESLTDEQRINTLQSYYNKELEEVYYIFVIKGLKGNIEIDIGDVSFYSPNKKKFLIHDQHNEEDLQRINNNGIKFIQAAVKTKYLSTKSSLINAISTLENTLDLISCYFDTKTPLEIDVSNYIVCKNGKFIHSTKQVDKRNKTWVYQDSLDITKHRDSLLQLENYNFLLKDKKDKAIIVKLSNAIHWYSKAEHSTRQEDKMLNYWIAIENLFNLEFDIKDDLLTKNKSKFSLIQEVITSVQIPFFVYDYGWEMYYHYRNVLANTYGDKLLSEEIIINANLNPKDGEEIHLEKFINSLKDIKKLEKNQYILNKLEELIQFYNNKGFATKIIDEQIESIKNDVLMIYRFRNLIVHNAYFDNTLLSSYVWKIKNFSGRLIRKLISSYNGNDLELSRLMINIFLEKELLKKALQEGDLNLFKN